MGKLTVIAVLAIVAAVCIVPATADDSDGATTVTLKVSDKYVYHCSFIMPEGERYYQMSCMTFVDGSDAYMEMQAYLADPENNMPPRTDDTAAIVTGQCAGMLIHAYDWSFTPESPSINTYVGWIDGDIVMEPLNGNVSISVRPGDSISIRLISSTDEDGFEPSMYVNFMGQSYQLDVGDDPFTREVRSLTTFSVGLGDYNYDDNLVNVYVFEYEGGSVPNGSATVFAAICIIIAALVVAVLAVAALKPKWSK